MTQTVRKTFSLTGYRAKQIMDAPIKNKSKIVNEALDLYFRKQEALAQAQKNWRETEISASLENFAGGYTTTINPQGEKITDDLLEDTLRSHAK